MRSCPSCGSIYNEEVEHCGLDGDRLVVTDVDPLIGATIDRYHVVERLGAGGMACVYRAQHQTLDREFAVKVLYGEMAADKKVAERFRREAQASSRISHPNVVAVTDYGRTPEGLTFMVMEMIYGKPLNKIIAEQGALDSKRAADVARQIASGLSAAHNLGFVHRDLKPGNVMLISDGSSEVAKILDFGLVRVIDEELERHDQRLTQTGHAMGTPYYMAPEQIRGEEVTSVSDLYALGTVIYEMLAGHPPFRGKMTEILIKHATEPPPALAPADGLDVIAMKLLEKEPPDRPQSAEEVIESIDRLGYDLRTTSVPILNTGGVVPKFHRPVSGSTPVGAAAVAPSRGHPAQTLSDSALAEAIAPALPGSRWLIPVGIFAILVASGISLFRLFGRDSQVIQILPSEPELGAAVEPEPAEPFDPAEPKEPLVVAAPPTPPTDVEPKPEAPSPTQKAKPERKRPDRDRPEKKLKAEAPPAVRPGPPTPPVAPARATPTLKELNDAMALAVLASGLSVADLERIDTTKAAAQEWTAARRNNDLQKAGEAHARLLAAIPQVRIPKSILKEKLKEIEGLLGAASSSKGNSKGLKELESRYFELGGALMSGDVSAERSRELAQQMKKLKKELSAFKR